MTPKLLRRAGEQTFGRGWIRELARVTGRAPITVRRWARPRDRGGTNMSDADIVNVTKMLLYYSKERHQRLRTMLIGFKNQENLEIPENSTSPWPKRKSKVKTTPPWKKIPQQPEPPPEFPDF